MRLFILIAVLFLFSSSAFAGKVYEWEGDVDSSWTSNGNWSDNPATNGGRPFVIPGPATYDDAPVITTTPSTYTIEGIDMQAGSLVQMRGGTVNVEGDVGVRGGSELIITGGTMNISGDLFVFDANSSVTVNGGDLEVNGDIIYGGTDGTASGANGATSMNILNGLVTATNFIFDNTTGDTHTLNISGGALVVSNDIRSDGEDVIMNVSGSSIIDINGDLEMDGGNDALTMSNGTITLAGDWVNFGTASLSGGLIRFDGVLTQDITNSNGSETFYRLRLENTLGGIRLNDSIIVTNRIIFNNGIIDGNGNSVTINDNVLILNVSDNSHVNGPVNKIGNNSFTFPIGDGGFYRPIGITAPNSVNDMYRAEYVRTNPGFLFSLLNRVTSIITASQLEYWTLDRKIGSSNENVVLSWDANSLVNDPNDLIVVRWDDTDGEWKDEGNGGTTGDATAGTITSANPISSFSPFTLGSSSINNPLPIELVSFEAKKVGEQVLLQWSTAAEINNSHYRLEKTFDGRSVEEIATVNSKAPSGNSNERLEYSYFDQADYNGTAYYRLVQVDHNGTEKSYPYQAVSNFNNKSEFRAENVKVYPNPIVNHRFKVSSENISELEFELYQLNGSRVPFVQNQIHESLLQIELTDQIPAGFLILRIVHPKTKEILESKKLIIRQF